MRTFRTASLLTAVVAFFAASPAGAQTPQTKPTGAGLNYTCQASAPGPVNTERSWVRCSDSHLIQTSAANVDTDISAGGGISLINTGAGLSGGPITSTGTIDLRLNASGGLVKNLGGGTNELGIGAASVTNAMLANSSVTVNLPAAVFAGSGAVALGGTQTFTLQTQAANSVWAGPMTGAASAPTFRALVNADLPTTGVSATTYGNSSNVGQFAVNAQGVITSASNVAISATAIGAVTSVTGSAPIQSSGGQTPAISCPTCITGSPSAIGDVLASTSGGQAQTAIADVSAGSYFRSGGVAALPAWSTLKLSNAATTGDVFVATGSNTMGNLADVAAGSFLRSGGVGSAVAWSTTTWPNAATTGDLVTASGSNAFGTLADVAAGSFLRSGGVGAAPAWSTTTWPNSATTGDIVTATGSNTFGTLADVAAGSLLRSGGAGAAPVWSTTTWPNAATTGDILIATGTNAIGSLADVATTNVLLSGGVGVAPSWGKVANAALTNSSVTVTAGAGLATTSSSIALGGSATLSVGGTADATYSTGAFTWAGASGKAMSLTSTAATISITAASASTWDSADGTVKGSAFDRTTVGAMTVCGTTATSCRLGGSNLTSGLTIGAGSGQNINVQYAGSTAIAISSTLFQWASATAGNRTFNIANAAADTAGNQLSISAGGAGTVSASNGQAGGQLFGSAGPGAAASGAFTAGAGGQTQWIGGSGGAGTASLASGAGGTLLLAGGPAGTNNGGGQGAGGALTLRGGVGGTNGAISIGATNTSSVAIGVNTIPVTVTGGSTSLLDMSAGSGITSTTTGNNTLNGNVTIAAGKTLTGSINAIGTAATVHTSIQNTTAAANGAQQYSPVFELVSQGWNPTASASRTIKWGLQAGASQASGDPAPLLMFYTSVPGVSGGAYTERLLLEDTFNVAILRLGGPTGESLSSGALVNGVQAMSTQTMYPDRDSIQFYSIGHPQVRYYDTFALRGNYQNVGMGDGATPRWGDLYMTPAGYEPVNTTSVYGLYSFGGQSRFSQIPNMGSVTVTPTGGVATGASYAVVAVDRNGNYTLASTGNTSSGPSTFDATHFNTSSWTAVNGAVYYDVYAGTVSQANWLGSVTTTSFKDTIGSAASNGRYTTPGAGAVFSVVTASYTVSGGTGSANTYFVYAADADGHLSAASSKTSAPTPTTANPVTLGWSPVGGAAYYVIARGTNTNIIGQTNLQPYSNGTTTAGATVGNGGLVRTGGTTVTATIATGHTLRVGDTFTLTSADANFPSGTYTVATVTSATVFTYSNAGSNVTSANVAISYTGPTVPGSTFVDYAYPGRTAGTAARNSTGDQIVDGRIAVQSPNTTSRSALETWSDGNGATHYGVDAYGFDSLGSKFEFRENWLMGQSLTASTSAAFVGGVWGYSTTANATGSTSIASTFLSGSPISSGLKIGTGTASGNGTTLSMQSSLYNPQGITNSYAIAEFPIYLTAVGANNATFRVGLAHIGMSNTHPSGYYFSKTSTDTNWQCNADDGTTTNTANTNVPPVANTIQMMRIEYYGAGTVFGAKTAVFKIDGATVCTLGSNVYNADFVEFEAWATATNTITQLFMGIGPLLIQYNMVALPQTP